ncbi:MAG: alpha/beta fold hydrolase [Spirochaetes bacterium]|nr:alpha/beta fold hydrolase [Spirochaetota bacterium]
MTRTKKRILVIIPALLVAAAAALYVAAGDETRGIISYFAWRALSPRSGEGHYCTLKGHRIYYEIHGSGEPLLLLHGGTAFIESFFMQIPALSSEFRVIAPDSRGHGRSDDVEGPLHYAAMASDMAALLKALEIEDAYVVGWSDGGIIGIDLASRHPDLVKKLVVIGTNYRADGLTAESIEFTRGMRADSPGLSEVRDFYRRIAPDPDRWPQLIGKVRAMWLREPNYTPADLGRITAPTLVIAGEHDMIRREHTLEMCRLIRGARCEIVPGATHKVPIERADLVNGMIVQFLRE